MIEIKNKNILLNLQPDEEVVYVAEKSRWKFYIWAPLVIFTSLIFLFAIIMFVTKKAYLTSPFIILFSVILFYLSLVATYCYIRDYFFTELVLTNQRIIISRFNKLIFIPLYQIKDISGNYSAQGPPVTIIKTVSKKTYRCFFIDDESLLLKFFEYCKNRNAWEPRTIKAWEYVIIIIIIVAASFAKIYFNSNNDSKKELEPATSQQKTTQSYSHIKDSNPDYFKDYMANLQASIKSNWHPPKSSNSNSIIVMFRVAKDGKLLNSKIIKSSKDMATDAAAIEALQKTAPFKPLPPQFKGKNVDIQFTFDYNVWNKR